MRRGLEYDSYVQLVAIKVISNKLGLESHVTSDLREEGRTTTGAHSAK